MKLLSDHLAHFVTGVPAAEHRHYVRVALLYSASENRRRYGHPSEERGETHDSVPGPCYSANAIVQEGFDRMRNTVDEIALRICGCLEVVSNKSISNRVLSKLDSRKTTR